jgi:hypothetical protein
MPEPHQSAPVIVPLREVARLFANNESAIADQAAKSGPEDALALAAIGRTLRKIQDSPPVEDKSRVMTTEQNGPISRLQSLIASGERGDLELLAVPQGGLEAKFDTGDWLGWVSVAWARIRHPRNHKLIKAAAKAEPFPNSGRIAILGDWGTGLYGAPEIAKTINKDKKPYAMLLHLGDVYYSGTESEVQERFLDLWPKRPEAISRAVNANHEMYSGGHGYFKKILPSFKQKASYFAHQNDSWTLVGLDVAHKDHDIDDAQVKWLQKIVDAARDRKVILFSHHQLFSHFESQGKKLWAHPEFKKILKSKKIFAWYWGHEHRCCIYENPHPSTGILARCIGHGGMPDDRKTTRNLKVAKGIGPADWRRAPATKRSGITVPQSLVLEGRNPFMGKEADKFLPHGYAVLNFDGPSLTEQVLDPTGKVIFEKTLV